MGKVFFLLPENLLFNVIVTTVLQLLGLVGNCKKIVHSCRQVFSSFFVRFLFFGTIFGFECSIEHPPYLLPRVQGEPPHLVPDAGVPEDGPDDGGGNPHPPGLYPQLREGDATVQSTSL